MLAVVLDGSKHIQYFNFSIILLLLTDRRALLRPFTFLLLMAPSPFIIHLYYSKVVLYYDTRSSQQTRSLYFLCVIIFLFYYIKKQVEFSCFQYTLYKVLLSIYTTYIIIIDYYLEDRRITFDTSSKRTRRSDNSITSVHHGKQQR
jgi:hypothetical protein